VAAAAAAALEMKTHGPSENGVETAQALFSVGGGFVSRFRNEKVDNLLCLVIFLSPCLCVCVLRAAVCVCCMLMPVSLDLFGPHPPDDGALYEGKSSNFHAALMRFAQLSTKAPCLCEVLTFNARIYRI
jgi:hypothetical protein